MLRIVFVLPEEPLFPTGKRFSSLHRLVWLIWTWCPKLSQIPYFETRQNAPAWPPPSRTGLVLWYHLWCQYCFATSCLQEAWMQNVLLHERQKQRTMSDPEQQYFLSGWEKDQRNHDSSGWRSRRELNISVWLSWVPIRVYKSTNKAHSCRILLGIHPSDSLLHLCSWMIWSGKCSLTWRL